MIKIWAPKEAISPSKNKKEINIILSENSFRKGDVITVKGGEYYDRIDGVITKAYKQVWLKRLLTWLGFRFNVYQYKYRVKLK